MTDIKALIIEDEASARSTLIKFLGAYCPEVIILAEAGSVKEGLQAIEIYKPELVFMDVQMGDGDGFDVLQKLREINFELIFISGFDTYAIKAIKYAAIDYLLKPLIPDELKLAVDKVIKKKAENPLPAPNPKPRIATLPNSRIAVPDSVGLKIIHLNKILYCKADSNYTLFVLAGQENILVCRTLKEYETILPSTFVRIHNSYLVNLEHVMTYVKGRGGQVEMSNGDHLDVARNRKQEFLDMLTGGIDLG